MKQLGPDPLVDPTARVERCRLGRYTEIGARTSLIETEVGDYSYVVNDCDAIYSRIGKFCSIASHVRINPGDHPMWRVSQSHFTYRASAYFLGEQDEAEFFDWRRARAVSIGNDVWIGHGVVVLAGRAIGDGAVVAAGAVVTKDIPSYSIAAGVPAAVKKQRFPSDIARRLERLAWWDWDHARLQAALSDFRSLTPQEFLAKHDG